MDATGWYERYNIEKPNPHNSFIFVPDYITDSWPAPNYDNPESRAVISRVIEPLTLGLACVAVALRLCSRLIGSKKLFREDYLILAAVFFCALKSAIVIASTTVGFGLRRYDIHPNDVRMLNKYYMMGILFYLACVMFTKASIILRYKRMFPPEVTHIRQVSQILVAGFFALFTVTVILMVNTCRPVPSLWSYESPGKCINVQVLYICNIAGNFVVDFAIYLLPIPYLWKLNLPKRQRLKLVVIFGLGFSVCCVALAELVVSVKLHDDGFFDWTWKGPLLWSCTAFELLFAITAASLPDLKALVAKFLPRLVSHGSNSDDHNMEAGMSPRDGAQHLAIVNPAALSPGLVDGNRGSKRLSRPYWLRSQLEGSLFDNSIPSRRGSAVPSAEGDTSAAAAKQMDGSERAEKRVTMIFEEEDINININRHDTNATGSQSTCTEIDSRSRSRSRSEEFEQPSASRSGSIRSGIEPVKITKPG
ncbi:hypothetical protein TWF730_006220 [Orbilia blumenaviensis]|uniref:Rhodopsin domain-containing protein n=1 Tax=Orbilia blumenaviensis TaxID=1796055 RepID=A0AAV9VGP1_9PEZI